MARVLFLCKQNAGRSQMSQALFEQVADGHHQSRSAGTRPAQQIHPVGVGGMAEEGTRPAQQIHPVVVEAMREQGIDLSARRPERLTDDLAAWADVVVTMGCGDECPYIPGKTYVDWDLIDPDGKSLGEVRAIRDDIGARVT